MFYCSVDFKRFLNFCSVFPEQFTWNLCDVHPQWAQKWVTRLLYFECWMSSRPGHSRLSFKMVLLGDVDLSQGALWRSLGDALAGWWKPHLYSLLLPCLWWLCSTTFFVCSFFVCYLASGPKSMGSTNHAEKHLELWDKLFLLKSGFNTGKCGKGVGKCLSYYRTELGRGSWEC